MEFVTILLLFCFGFGGRQDIRFPTKDRTTSPALEGGILTAGLPGKSQDVLFKRRRKVFQAHKNSMCTYPENRSMGLTRG